MSSDRPAFYDNGLTAASPHGFTAGETLTLRFTGETGSRLRALEQELTAYKLLDPKLVLSLGMKGIGDNAGKIGNLTVTTELLAGILNDLGKNN